MIRNVYRVNNSKMAVGVVTSHRAHNVMTSMRGNQISLFHVSWCENNYYNKEENYIGEGLCSYNQKFCKILTQNYGKVHVYKYNIKYACTLPVKYISNDRLINGILILNEAWNVSNYLYNHICQKAGYSDVIIYFLYV